VTEEPRPCSLRKAILCQSKPTDPVDSQRRSAPFFGIGHDQHRSVSDAGRPAFHCMLRPWLADASTRHAHQSFWRQRHLRER